MLPFELWRARELPGVGLGIGPARCGTAGGVGVAIDCGIAIVVGDGEEEA